MKRIFYIFSILIVIAIFSCKKEFLNYTPNGEVSSADLNNPTAIDALVIAAYANLSNDFFIENQWAIPWEYGSVRGDEAYKGGGGVTDNADQHAIETFYSLTPSSTSIVNASWVSLYENIGRDNEALRRINSMTDAQYPNKEKSQAECRFLRGHWNFLLKILYKHPVWAGDSVAKADLNTISNRVYTSDQYWDKIAEDFQFAVDNLPKVQTQVGRANKVAAEAYLAKVRLYQAYEQDENNNVTSIDASKLQEVVNLCDSVILSGKYHLNSDFANNFLCGHDNGPESVFAVQFSQNDGTLNGKVQFDCGICYNMATQYGCCDFLNPSYSMLNTFKTDPKTGLPMFDTYNSSFLYNIDTWANLTDNDMISSIDWMTPTVDPRMDHTVGIPTHPWKYDPNFVMTKSWRRVPETYGYLTSMKSLELYDSPCFVKIGPFMGTSRNADIIRYDEVLLWKAEAEIELGQQMLALPLINQIRERAAASTGMLKRADGTPISNYMVNDYVDGLNCTWTQAFARQALQWEDKLEFCTEGRRFFDLVRWGIAAETMNAYFAKEVQEWSFLTDAHMTKNRDEYLPIPQIQINFVKPGLYVQNNGW